MAEPLAELKKVRAQKLEKIVSLGVNPYPSLSPAREDVAAARTKRMEQEVNVAGRLRGWRAHGAVTFADLNDASGQLQLFFQRSKLSAPQAQLLPLLDLGDFVSVSGSLFQTAAGELTIAVKDFALLAKALRPLPSLWHGLKDVEERYRQRYVDLLLNPQVNNVFKTRAKVLRYLRNCLEERGFVEVETPVLQPLYGGATAQPFTTHHRALNTDFYLRISDELYLKRLIVGGWEKIYELGKDFRNEGIDREHSPEFTMLEFYWAYTDYQNLMNFTEEFLSSLVKEVVGSYQVKYQGQVYDFTPPWPRRTLRALLRQETGIDLETALDEATLKQALSKGKITLDLAGVVGYGPLLDALYKKVVRAKIKGPLLLADHPYPMRPLAKRKEDDPPYAASFQLVVAGFEWLNAYSEQNDPREQRARWEEEVSLAKKGLVEHQVLDEDYLRALEYGMPPTAGWGLGVDRLVAFLTDQPNLKDVILFPTLKPENLGGTRPDGSKSGAIAP